MSHRLASLVLVVAPLVGCASSSGVSGNTIGATVVVRPQDDPAAVSRALLRVQTDLDEAERRLRELEQRAHTGSAAPADAPAPAPSDPPSP